MMVTENVSTATDLNILKGSSPFAIDDHMIYLVLCVASRQAPGEFVDCSVREDGSSNNTAVGSRSQSASLYFFIHESTSMCAHCSHVVGVISPYFDIKVTNCDNSVVGPENQQIGVVPTSHL